jgi:hypothetical protein
MSEELKEITTIMRYMLAGVIMCGSVALFLILVFNVTYAFLGDTAAFIMTMASFGGICLGMAAYMEAEKQKEEAKKNGT